MVGPTLLVCVLFWFTLHCCAFQAPPAAGPQQALPSYMAFLTTPEDGASGVVCSGTIIHERFVLTAADCFYSSTGEPISYQHKVLIASDYKDIRRLIPAPKYYLRTWVNNVGLIELADKIVFGPLVSKMRLAQTEDLQVDDVANTTCWVLKDGNISLQEESVEIAPRRRCGPPNYGRYITKDMFCAVAYTSCAVDSGAPLLKGGRQVGVASRQYHARIVFSNTNRLRLWIANTLFEGHMEEYLASHLL